MFYRHPEVFYIYLILRLVSPDGPPWLEIRGQDKFLCVFYTSRILDNMVINLQKERKTFSRKIPGSYKYCKIVKIAVYVFRHTRIVRVFGKQSKINKGGVHQFSFFGNQNFLNVKCQKEPPSVLKYFPKIQ